MTDITTYKKRLYQFYEVYNDKQTSASGTNVKVTGKLAHADVIAAAASHKLERTLVYLNGVRNLVTGVALNAADTDITVTDTIVSGDYVDVYLACTTGTLENNTATGKFPLVEVQALQKYGATSNTVNQLQCGTERVETIKFSSDGESSIGIIRRGNDNFNNFKTARANKTYLMIIIKDTTDAANTVYDTIREVRVTGYSRGTRAIDAKGGEIVDTVRFRFVPPVAIST